MRMILAITMALAWLLSAVGAFAQNPVHVLNQSTAATVTNWYTENLRDPSASRIGDVVKDPLGGHARAAPVTVGVGGLVGFGERDTLAPTTVLDTENPTGPARQH